MMNMVVTLQKMKNNSLPWLPKSKLAEPIYAQLNNARWLSARRKLGSRPRNEETGQSRRFTLAVGRPLFRSSSTLLQSSSHASTTRHPAPAAPSPDPAFSRSTSSDARTSRSSPVHANDRNGGGLLTPAVRSARGRLSSAQLGLDKSSSHALSPSPAEAMHLMPASKEESRKGKGVQRFASGEQAEEEEDWGKSASDESPSSGLSESSAERPQVQDIFAGKQRIQGMILSSDPKRDQRRKRYLRHRTLVRSDSQGR
ncbi:BQ5605_C031g10900 [Microbotryum silenes-dioicae]|uniref:BQ5605_C031g10900 protein n=1 Tax=Microbotryum silenes-dioicae TaxID=796604 RepID=A0A2X0PIH1_9BASI|nr:BQ5605_C031g10900 [Microbotryum silenes-dioicae]